MADFCKACSEELFGKDFGDLRGLTSDKDLKKGRAALVICEGCGPIQVDPLGQCISKDCLQQGKAGHGVSWEVGKNCNRFVVGFDYKETVKVVIEAFQMTKDRREDNSEWPEWLNRAWNKDFDEVGMVGCEDFPNSNGKDRLIIRTPEGIQTVSWDDFIIQGVHGELYSCKPDIFRETYESA